MHIHVCAHVCKLTKKKKKVKVKKSGTLKLLVSLINMWIIRSRESRRADQSTPCCRFNIFAHIKKKKTYSTFKKHDCMEGKSVADERGRRERKFSERRRSEALVRERNVSEEVSGRAMRKLFCNRLHRKKKEALDNFHLM